MNSSRLFVLGSLARQGAMHGHQIRRAARVDRSDLWTEVKAGSLYGVLHRMRAEGLVRPVRTEQDGNLPARTVYEITPDGRRELAVQLREALRSTRIVPDPVDLAVLYGAGELPRDELASVVRERRESYVAQLAAIRRLYEAAEAHLTAVQRMTFQHTLMRLETEVAWHEEFLALLPELLTADDYQTDAAAPEESTRRLRRP